MEASNVLNGVTVHVQYEGNGGNSLFLLDMTPETNLDLYTRDPALVAGESFLDPDGITTITTDWTDASGAMVSVSLAQPPCVTSNPTLSLSPPESQWVEPGTPVTYTATVSNRDSASCAVATFNVAASMPAGWTVSLADSSLVLEPGASDTTTVTVTSPADAGDGFYDVTVSAEKASDPAYAANATVTYVVNTPAINQPPLALDDVITIQDKNPVTINVLANDADPDGDILIVTTVTNGAKGAVTINANNTITYSPAKSFKNGDSFTYGITDGAANATATVTITLQGGDGGGKGGRKPKK
jgi:hypothetical protein